MKTMNRLTFMMAFLGLMTACGSTPGSSLSSSAGNTAPTIEGTLEETSIYLGETFDALSGVTASDIEDGDLTNQITLTSIPALINNEGVLIPDAEGDYFLTYAVTDEGGLTAEAYTTLTVLEPLATETLFKEYTFVEDETINIEGWQIVLANGAVASYGPENGTLALVTTSLGNSPDDIALLGDAQAMSSASQYKVEFTLHSNIDAHGRLVILEGETPTIFATEDFVTGSDTTTPSVSFSPTSVDALIRIGVYFGAGINTNPATFFISSIRIETTTGTEIETPLIEDDFALGIDGWNYNVGAGAVATLALGTQNLAFEIQNFASENNPWNINLYRQSNIDLVAGHQYRVRFSMTVANSQFFELCFEDYRLDWQIRAGFRNGTFEGTTAYVYDFTASMNITDLFIKLALGKGTATSNSMILDDFSFMEVTGDQISETVTHAFVSGDEEALWGTFNGEGGVGTLYCEDGALVYDIASFGLSDWHNKMFIKKLSLDALASYRFELTLSANKDLQAAFIVNELGAWNPQINQTISISTSPSILSFTSSEDFLAAMDIEILFQFGGFASNIAPASVVLSSLKVFKIA